MKSIPSWYYNEFQQIGTDYASPLEVKQYDARMQTLRDINGEIEKIIMMTHLSEKDVILELGCGTGELLINLARKCKLIYGLDVSPIMLEYAQHKIDNQALNNVKLFNAGFLTYQHKGEPVNIAISQLALHHLPDFWKAIALKNVHSLLKPGGYFFLRDVVYPSGLNDYSTYFNNSINNLEGEARDEIAHEIIMHIKNEYSTLDWIMEGLLQKCGFTIKHNINDGFTTIYLCEKPLD